MRVNIQYRIIQLMESAIRANPICVRCPIEALNFVEGRFFFPIFLKLLVAT